MPIKDPEKRKEYQRQYFKKWYGKNKENFKKQVADANKIHRKKVTEWVKEYKIHSSCILCGESDFYCLDFHHLNPEEKEFNISNHGQYMTITDVIMELEKTVCLCANCHRKIHHHYNGNIFAEGISLNT